MLVFEGFETTRCAVRSLFFLYLLASSANLAVSCPVPESQSSAGGALFLRLAPFLPSLPTAQDFPSDHSLRHSDMAPCTLCPSSPARAILSRPKTLQPVCKACFFEVFETEIHNTIMGFGQAEGSGKGKGKGKELFRRGERVSIGASGGKGEWRLVLRGGCRFLDEQVCWDQRTKTGCVWESARVELAERLGAAESSLEGEAQRRWSYC